MRSSVVRKRRSLSGRECGPSFTRFGSTIWTKSRPRTGARITRVLSAVCIAACGGKGSLLGSRVRPTAVKPMGPKVQEERVGEAKPELGWVLGGPAAATEGDVPAGRLSPDSQTARVGPSAVHVFCCGESLLSPMTLGARRCGVGGLESGGQVRGGFEGEEVPVGILLGSRGEGVLAVVQHVPRVGGREGAGLCAEVQEDGVGFPPSQGTDGCFVHT